MSGPGPRLALYGYLGSGNFGNDASFETVLAWLRRAHPGVELSCITLAPDAVEHRYGIPSVPLAALAARTPDETRAPVVRRLLGRLLDAPRSYRLAGTRDVVMVPGMGVLEESLGVRPWGLPTWLFWMAAACRLRGRAFVLLDVGAEPALNPITRWLFAATTRLATHVSCRDEWSAQAIRGAGGLEPDDVAPDLAFAHPASTRTVPESGRIVVGVMAYYGRRGDVVRGAAVRQVYVASMVSALVRLLDDGCSLVLLGGDLLDADVAAEIAVMITAARPGLDAGRVRLARAATFTEVSEEMARAEVVIASRFHNLIAALRLTRPTVSVGYAEKSARLMHSLALEAFHQDIESLDPDRLVEQVRSARGEASHVSARLDTVIGGYAAEVDRLLETVTVQVLQLSRTDGATTS